MWKHSMLADLWDLCFRGHLPMCMQGFLPEHSFRVRVGSTLSELHERGWGIHKLVLSPALFSIKITNIVNADLKGTDCSLFVQDFALFVWGKSLNRVERALQLYVDIIQDWVSENGFKFSDSEMLCIHFTSCMGFSRPKQPSGNDTYQSSKRS